jgi:hypothetical protein
LSPARLGAAAIIIHANDAMKLRRIDIRASRMA